MDTYITTPAITVHCGQTVDLVLLIIGETEIGNVIVSPDPRKVPALLTWQGFCEIDIDETGKEIATVKLRLSNSDRVTNIDLPAMMWYLAINQTLMQFGEAKNIFNKLINRKPEVALMSDTHSCWFESDSKALQDEFSQRQLKGFGRYDGPFTDERGARFPDPTNDIKEGR